MPLAVSATTVIGASARDVDEAADVVGEVVEQVLLRHGARRGRPARGALRPPPP